LSSLLAMKAHMVGIPFQLYITVKDAVIRAVLMQVTESKEHIITYLSRHIIDAKTRYFYWKVVFIFVLWLLQITALFVS
jgi:hypothetical protein